MAKAIYNSLTRNCSLPQECYWCRWHSCRGCVGLCICCCTEAQGTAFHCALKKVLTFWQSHKERLRLWYEVLSDVWCQCCIAEFKSWSLMYNLTAAVGSLHDTTNIYWYLAATFSDLSSFCVWDLSKDASLLSGAVPNVFFFRFAYIWILY